MAVKTYATTDPDVIRRWAEDRHGKPVLLKQGGVGTQAPHPGIVFSEDNDSGSADDITWQELFDKRAEANLVFLYQEKPETNDASSDGRFVSQQVAAEAVSASADQHASPSDPDVLAPTESHQTPLARGTRAFRHPEQVRRVSKGALVGMIVFAALIIVLIAVAFWPDAP
jgi:hypothetical protein